MNPIQNESDLDEALSRPTPGVLKTLRQIPGDVMILGAGGKMGPTLARMLSRAADQLADRRKILAVSRFSSAAARQSLSDCGVHPVACDLTDRDAVGRLPDVPNVIFMTGQKFGTSENPEMTWVMNTLVPATVAERFRQSRMVVFSTGCVYPLTSVTGPGSKERDVLEPLGEYSNSCVGRERVFTHFSKQYETPMLIFRLNYAIDLRYGVLRDVAQKVFDCQPVDVTNGWVNVIWQGDANARAIQSLALTESPPNVLNVTGAEHVSIRELAVEFGRRFGREAMIVGNEAPTALLSDAAKSFEQFGPLTVSLNEMIDTTAEWIKAGGTNLNKPTHFEARDGRF